MPVALRFLILLGALASGTMAGVAAQFLAEDDRQEAGTDELAAIDGLSKAGRFAEAVRGYEELLRKPRSDALRARATFELGRTLRRWQRPAEAIPVFERLLPAGGGGGNAEPGLRSPTLGHQRRAALEISECHEELGDYRSACRMARAAWDSPSTDEGCGLGIILAQADSESRIRLYERLESAAPAGADRLIAAAAAELGAGNEHAARILARSGRTALPALVAIVEDRGSPGRMRAIELIASIGIDASHLPWLARQLAACQDGIAWHFIRMIQDADLDATTLVPVLVKLLDQPAVRGIAAEALVFIGRPAVEALLAPPAPPSPVAIVAALKVLEDLGFEARSAYTPLVAWLPGTDECLQMSLLRTLGTIGAGEQDAPALVRAFRTPGLPHPVRAYLIYALGEAGGAAAEAEPELAAIAADHGTNLRDRAKDALALLGPRRLEILLERAGNRSGGTWQRDGFRALSRMGRAADPVLPALLAMGRSGEPFGDIWAWLRAMGELLVADALPFMIKVLREDSADGKAAAAEALRLLGPLAKSAAEELRAQSHHADPSVRRNVRAALRQIAR